MPWLDRILTITPLLIDISNLNGNIDDEYFECYSVFLLKHNAYFVLPLIFHIGNSLLLDIRPLDPVPFVNVLELSSRFLMLLMIMLLLGMQISSNFL